MIIKERFNITGRGMVQVVTLEKDDPPLKLGDTIVFDGIEYIIRGLEQMRQGPFNTVSPTQGVLIRPKGEMK